MIKNAISESAYFRLVTTTSIVAKLAVCAILLASMSSAHAANNTKLPAHKAGHSKSTEADKASEAKLVKLEREWKRLHSRRQAAVLNRLVVCRELGQCDGLKLHPTLGAALIGVSPERPARGVYAAAKAKKPLMSARLRSKQPPSAAPIRSAAADADGNDTSAASLPYGGAWSVNR